MFSCFVFFEWADGLMYGVGMYQADPAGGPDLLTVGGQSLWALCPNTTVGGRNDLVWSPVANHAHYSLPSCQEVDIQMIPA